MSDDKIDWKEQRAIFAKEELFRYRMATRVMLVFALSVTVLFVALVFGKVAPLNWEAVSLLVVAIISFALPLLSKFSISKDGGSFDLSNPIDIVDRLEASEEKAESARSESFEQTRKQIGALSLQVSELSSMVQRPNISEMSEFDMPSGGANVPVEPNLRAIKKLLPKPTVDDDPQKGRFGGSASSKNRVLSAEVTRSEVGRGWYSISFKLASTDKTPLNGLYAYFFLHNTFDPSIYRVNIPPKALSVSFDTTAIGAFTAGVVADRGTTKLEIDLASDEVSAPKSFKEN